MKSIIVLIMMFPAILIAESKQAAYTLKDNATGEYFHCSRTGSGGGGSNPSCIEKIARYCSNNTVYGATKCFDTASSVCKDTAYDFSDCVVQTANYCNQNTVYGATRCFENALASCKGNPQSLRGLLEGVKAFSKR